MTWRAGLRLSAAVGIGLGVLAGGTRPANAVDGVIEINQQKALAGGINGSLAADPAGFPVTITQPGSYRLTGNLSVNQTTTAIEIPSTVQRVSLDLGGFSIEGPNVCSGNPVTCTYQTSAGGVAAADASQVSVRNGRISGIGGSGVLLGADGLIEDLEIASSGGAGAYLYPNGTVRRVRASSNRTVGIGARMVSDSEARQNQTGIVLNDDTGIVSGCLVDQNAKNGIDGWVFGNTALISRSTIRRNGGNGIEFSDPGLGEATLVDSFIADNVGCGALFSSPGVPNGRTAGIGNNSFIGNNTGGQCVGGAPGQNQVGGNVVATSCNAITCTTGTLQVGTFCPPISTVTCL